MYAPSRIMLREISQHFRQQFHRQSDDIRLAARDDVNPIESILVSKGPGLSLPLLAIQVRFELLVGQWIHDELRRSNA